jgi:choline dehydrogenase-like flavoprotein
MVHDYVIVGAGSAGCVLANRLSADPDVTVLLLEAGGSDRAFNVQTPAAFSKLFRTERDWNFNTQPEPHLDGRSLYIPRGKMLGGSHSMNAMLYVRGDRADYDSWRDDHGCEGWGWDDVLPYFKRAEHNERGPSEAHAIGGPLNVADLRSPTEYTHRFVEACEQVGIGRTDDFNAGSPLGAGLPQVTQKDGKRFSTVDGYLAPAAKRPNLTVAKEAFAHRVLFDEGRAVGVEYFQAGLLRRAPVAREVILAAGAIASPQLLQLSGIGPADHLRSVGVDVEVDAPGVGANLQDHPVVGVLHEATAGGTLGEAESPGQLLKYLTRKTGMLTSSVAEALAFLDRDDDRAADLQLHFGPAYFRRHGFDTYDGDAVVIGPTLISPEARGTVRLRSADPTVHPDIVGNHLGPDSDMDRLVDGVQLAREVLAAPAFADVLGAPIEPLPELVGDDLRSWIRANAEVIYHPTSTCAMGTSDEAPIDPELRVKGVDGLRVVDASVMPTVTRGNTNAPTIMIAEKAADLITA